MNQEPDNFVVLWITSEICYYLGLVLAVLFLPALTFVLWVMSLFDKASPNYWYILIAWVMSVLIVLASVGLKNLICSENKYSNYWG